LPRRRPKKLRGKPERYHHSLKALAIREKKLHIAGQPELRIEGTPVFLDVEGIPDRDFYYLIGLRIRNGDSVVQHGLWADSLEGEKKIYFEFLELLRAIDKPSLIHYGSFETEFSRQMTARYGIVDSSRHRIQWKSPPNKPPVNYQWAGLFSNILQQSEEHCLLAWVRMVRPFISWRQIDCLPL
jgi:hypothetical protein